MRPVLKRKRLRTNILLALGADLAAKGATLVLFVAAAWLISIPEMARFGVAFALATITQTVLDCGVSMLLTRDGARSEAEADRMLGDSHWARLLLALCILPLFLLGGLITSTLTLALLCWLFSLASATAQIAYFRSKKQFQAEVWARTTMGAAGLGIAVVLLLLVARSAAMLIAGLTAATIISILILGFFAGAKYTRPSFSAVTLLRASAIFAALSIATLVYSRAETLLLKVLSSNVATASYALALTVAFGFLAFPNALTSGLLPHLAAELDYRRRWLAVRHSLSIAVAQGIVVLVAGIALSPWLLPALLGARYRSAVIPFCLLLGSNLFTAVAGVIGIALIAVGRQRVLGVQIAISLLISLTASLLLIPAFGAVGAAEALIAGEAAAVALLAIPCRRYLVLGRAL